MSLREEMRASCSAKLDDMAQRLNIESTKIVGQSQIKSKDLMRLTSGNRTDTLRKKLVSQLFAEAEEKLVKIWNDQVDAFVDDKAEAL